MESTNLEIKTGNMALAGLKANHPLRTIKFLKRCDNINPETSRANKAMRTGAVNFPSRYMVKPVREIYIAQPST
jgi:hypothetical protein